MSRTTRRKRPKMRLGPLVSKQYWNGTVRDGTPQHVSGGCDNHGGCPYCEGNRLFSSKKREPLKENE